MSNGNMKSVFDCMTQISKVESILDFYSGFIEGPRQGEEGGGRKNETA